jgi:hypothetical protein
LSGHQPGRTRPPHGKTYVPVIIWHNEYTDRDEGGDFTHWDGFDPDRNYMTPVFTFAYPCDTASEQAVNSLATLLRVMFDVPDPGMLAWEFDRAMSAQYRANRLRSVSAGDVIQIGSRYFALRNPGGHHEITAGGLTVAPSPWYGDWLTGRAVA